MWGLCLNVRNSPRGMLHKVSIITGKYTPPLPPTPPFIPDFCRNRFVHRDRYREQHQTEKIEIEVKDVDRIRITKVYASCPGAAFWGS
jgi:hypothetical protein